MIAETIGRFLEEHGATRHPIPDFPQIRYYFKSLPHNSRPLNWALVVRFRVYEEYIECESNSGIELIKCKICYFEPTAIDQLEYFLIHGCCQ